MARRIAVLLTAAMIGCGTAHADAVQRLYEHIFVIVEENHTADQVEGNKSAPNITRLAHKYGYASNFYSERHPSEPNYIAMLGGDTFGIADGNQFEPAAGQIE